MGALANLGQGIAQGISGPNPTAAGLANSSLGFGAASTMLGMGGSLFQGIGGMQQANFAASLARQNAGAALIAGGINESSSKMRFGALEHQQIANFAANGVGVDSEAVKATTGTTEAISGMDAALLHYNAAREAWGGFAQAAVDKKAAIGALAGGLMGVGSSFLTGASALSSKWLSYKQSFGDSASPSAYDYSTMGA